MSDTAAGMVELPISARGQSAETVARECAMEAGVVMRASFGRTAVAAVKGRGNVLTEVDLAVERLTMERLGKAFPDHSILAEETAAETRPGGWMWVVDPIDGTKNFSRGIPHFCFSLALCRGSKPVLGVTYQPLLDELFLATAGRGCTLNGTPVHVSDVASVRESVVAIDMGYDDARAARQIELARHLWPVMQGLRVPGSACLEFAFVAAGRWDLFLHSDLQPWDIAAGLILVREAGGQVWDRAGGEANIFSRAAVASNSSVYADFLRVAGDVPWQA